jgi:signal transduction histidine kinase
VLLAKTLRSRTFQLALLSIAGFGAIVLGLFAYVYWSTESFVLGRSDRAIEAEYRSLRQAYDNGGRDSLVRTINMRIADPKFEGAYLLADSSLRRIAGNLRVWPRELRGSGGFADLANTSPDPGVLRVTFTSLPDGLRLLVGRRADDLSQFAMRIGWALAGVIVLIVVLAIVASVFVTRRTVGRIESINATSREIMERGLDRRIPLRGSRDEWDQLADNLNRMLDRIETLMREVRQVTDNVAHDLRTPLTRMRGRLEKAADKTREPDHDQMLIADMISDLDDVLRIFSSLMRISQIEAVARTAGFRTIDLADIAREVVELFDAAAEEKGQRLTLIADGAAFVTGDRDLLFEAVANLVDNAIKHGVGQMTVSVAADETAAMVMVADHGSGIPPGEVERVFKRFYRLEQSRCSPGHGLGLSLVAAVARLHGASVEMEDNRPGLLVRLHVPRADHVEAKGSARAGRKPRGSIPAPPRC